MNWTEHDYGDEYYSNPIRIEHEWPDYGIGDPYVFRHDGRYYLYASNKDYRVGIRVWSSDDLVNWAYEGPCTNDEASTGAYAPEVVYWNGVFYLYTSPAGRGHYVYTASSPTGPFTRQTDNFGMTIDGSVFIDDDAEAYFSHACGEGIQIHRMDSLIAPRQMYDVIYPSFLGHWTEGSMIIKRNGYYYLTYTGNHVFSHGYRVNYSWSTESPLGPYTTPDHNPIIISTRSDYHGLGHSSTVMGPGLDSYYIVYHNLVGRSVEGPPVRYMNISRLVFNKGYMAVLGPATAPVAKPPLPVWSARLPALEDGFFVSPEATGPRFTAEFTFVLSASSAGAVPNGEVVWAAESPSVYSAIGFDLSEGVARFSRVAGGEVIATATAGLYAEFRPDVLHTVRVVQENGVAEVFLDGLRLLSVENAGHDGKIGFVGDEITPSFVAFSADANGSSDRTAQHLLPGSLEAVHGGDSSTVVHTDRELEMDYISVDDGVVLTYSVNVIDGNLMAIDAVIGGSQALHGEAVVDDGVVGRFELPPLNEPVHDDETWVRRRLATLVAPPGPGSLVVRFAHGSDAQLLRLIAYPVAADTGREEPFEWNSATVSHFVGFMTAGDYLWDDYAIRLDVDFKSIRDEIGVLFRVSNESGHPDQVPNAYMGYCLQLRQNGRVALYRNSYENRSLLGSARLDPDSNSPARLIVDCVDGLLTVRLGRRELIRVYDPRGFRSGSVGIQAGDLSKRHLGSALPGFEISQIR